MFRHPRPPRHAPESDAPLYYLVDLPVGYEKTSERWPVLMFLHSIGERGNNPDRVRAAQGLPRLIARGKQLPFIVVSPQCPANAWWSSRLSGLLRVLDEVSIRFRADPSRVCLTGVSMGGHGVWELAARAPERFAAAAPICPPAFRGPLERLLKVPVWAFHGQLDPVVPCAESEEMIAALRLMGHPDARLTLYPDADHDCWARAYSEPGLYDWMLARRIDGRP